jgi:hypothetical protein
VLSVALAFTGLAAGYARLELAGTEPFADRAG